MRRQCFAFILCTLASGAYATPPETIGFGARSIGSGGGGVAWVADPTAAHVNPAGLSHLDRPEAQLGLIYSQETFRELPTVWWDTNRDGSVDENDDGLAVSSNVDDTIGFTAATGRNVGKKFGIGLALYVPARQLMRFMTFEPSLPTYFMHYNRPQRLVLSLGFGGAVAPGLHIGAGFELVPGSESKLVATFSSGIHGTDDEDEVIDPIVIDVHQTSITLTTSGSPVLGIQLDFGQWAEALQGLRFGLVLKGPANFPLLIDADLQANLSLSEIGDLAPYLAAAVVKGQLHMSDHYVPLSVTSGLAYQTKNGHGATLDVIWKDWRPMIANAAQFKNGELILPLVDLSEALQDNNDTTLSLRPTVSLRAGAEFTLPEISLNNAFKNCTIRFRAGAGFDPTPLQSQGPSSALLDTDRVMVSAGVGVETADPLNLLGGPIQFDIYGQFHSYLPRFLPHASDTPLAGFPTVGDGFPIGGTGWVVGGQWRFEY